MNSMRTYITAIIIAMLCSTACALAGTPLGEIKLFAHRGLTTKFPENSMEAIRAAKDLGIYGTEIDLRTTKDNKIVLLHDAALGKMTTGRGQVAEVTMADIKKLFLKDSQGKPTKCKVAVFNDVLAKVSSFKGFVLAVDLKDVDVAKVCKQVTDQNMESKVYFFIPGPKAVATAKLIKSINSDLMISIDLLNWWQIMNVPEFVISALDADAVFASEWFFPRHGFSEAINANARVQVYLWGQKNLTQRMERAAALGANEISCDRPDILLNYIKSKTK